MNISEQLTKIRRFLRDPDATIWSNELLIRIFNQVQEDLQNKVKILEDVEAIKVPPTYHQTYMHEWEWAYLDSNLSRFYRCFQQHQQAQHIYTHVWEIQHVWDIDTDVSDTGAHFTQPWEAWFLTPGEEIRIRFPRGFHELRFITYDSDPICFETKKQLMERDSQWETTSGTPLSYYRPDELDDSFCLYPRPTNSNWTDGDGLALYQNGDTNDSENGVVIRRTGTTLSSDKGLTVDIIDLANNVFMVFEENAIDLTPNLNGTNYLQESNFPKFMRKYIEYGVLAKAFRANTDGRIQSLADYWQQRFDIGVQAIKRYKLKRKSDRHYQLTTKDRSVNTRQRQHPRLPAVYPSVSHIRS